MRIEDDAGSGFVFALASHVAHVAHTRSAEAPPTQKHLVAPTPPQMGFDCNVCSTAGRADSTAHPQEQSSPEICHTFPHNRVFEMIQLYSVAIHHRLMKLDLLVSC